MRTEQQLLAGWGGTSPSVATLVELDADEVLAPSLLDELDVAGRGVIARGLGRSYGDPAQNGGGVVVRLPSGTDSVELDAERGRVRAGAGVSFDELMRLLVPAGWFVPVTPGTRFVTVGGAIASDIHGKNHHLDGSFGHHVERIGLLLADGTHRSITPEHDPELWWATVGGMGLTGVITEATFRLLPIETSRCTVDTDRVPHLDALLELMEAGDADYRYSVAWIDLLASGGALGRSVLTRGDHTTLGELRAAGERGDALEFSPPALVTVPSGVPNVFSRPAIRAFNELWYRKAPARERGAIQTLTEFFHPLDMVGHWNRLYGRQGFLQYQFVLPLPATDTLRTIVARVAASGHASFVNVLKRFGPGNEGMLSFPRPGWTLTIDLPAGATDLARLLAELDELVLADGGRHYLAKDAHMTPEVVHAGYPRLEEWKSIRATVDPTGRWASDQARRLGLI